MHLTNKLHETLDYYFRDILNFDFLKSVWVVSPPHSVHDFSKKYFSCYALLTDQFHCPIVFTIWNTGQYVHCSCLFSRFWRHKFWKTWPKSQDKCLNILRTKRVFKVNKKHFSSVLKYFELLKIVSDLRVRF